MASEVADRLPVEVEPTAHATGEDGGEGAEAEHRALGELAARLGIQVLAVGDLGRLIAVGATDAGGTGEYLADVDALTGRLRSLVRPRDVVLVKASRGLALERVAEALAATTDEGDPA